MIENKLLCNIEEFTNNRDDIRSAFKDYITGKDLSINEKNEKFRMYEDAFSDTIGNKVRISNKKIEISYNSIQDLNRIMEILNINFND